MIYARRAAPSHHRVTSMAPISSCSFSPSNLPGRSTFTNIPITPTPRATRIHSTPMTNIVQSDEMSHRSREATRNSHQPLPLDHRPPSLRPLDRPSPTPPSNPRQSLCTLIPSRRRKALQSLPNLRLSRPRGFRAARRRRLTRRYLRPVRHRQSTLPVLHLRRDRQPPRRVGAFFQVVWPLPARQPSLRQQLRGPPLHPACRKVALLL